MMKNILSFLTTALLITRSLAVCEGQGTVECPVCEVSVQNSQVFAAFDLGNYGATAGLELVSLILVTDDFPDLSLINIGDLPTGIDFWPGQIVHPEDGDDDANPFGLVEDVPVDWNSQKVIIALVDIETEEIVMSSSFLVDE